MGRSRDRHPSSLPPSRNRLPPTATATATPTSTSTSTSALYSPPLRVSSLPNALPLPLPSNAPRASAPAPRTARGGALPVRPRSRSPELAAPAHDERRREERRRIERAERFGTAAAAAAADAALPAAIGTSRSRLQGIPSAFAAPSPAPAASTSASRLPPLSAPTAAAAATSSTSASTGFQIPYKNRTSRSRKRTRRDDDDGGGSAVEPRESAYRGVNVSPERERGATRWDRTGGGASDRFDRSHSSVPLTGANSTAPARRYRKGDLARSTDASTRYAPDPSSRSSALPSGSARRSKHLYSTPDSRFSPIGNLHGISTAAAGGGGGGGETATKSSSRKSSHAGTPRARSPDAFKDRDPVPEQNRDRVRGGEWDRDYREGSKLSQGVRARSRSYSPGEIPEPSSSRRPRYPEPPTHVGDTPPRTTRRSRSRSNSRTRSRSPTGRSQTPTVDSYHSHSQWRKRSPSGEAAGEQGESVVPISDTPPLPPNRFPKRTPRGLDDDDDDEPNRRIDRSDTPPRRTPLPPPDFPVASAGPRHTNVLPSRRRLPPSASAEPTLALVTSDHAEDTKPVIKQGDEDQPLLAKEEVRRDEEGEEEEEELEEGEEKEEGEIPSTTSSSSSLYRHDHHHHHHQQQQQHHHYSAAPSRYRNLPPPPPPPFVSASNATTLPARRGARPPTTEPIFAPSSQSSSARVRPQSTSTTMVSRPPPPAGGTGSTTPPLALRRPASIPPPATTSSSSLSLSSSVTKQQAEPLADTRGETPPLPSPPRSRPGPSVPARVADAVAVDDKDDVERRDESEVAATPRRDEGVERSQPPPGEREEGEICPEPEPTTATTMDRGTEQKRDEEEFEEKKHEAVLVAAKEEEMDRDEGAGQEDDNAQGRVEQDVADGEVGASGHAARERTRSTSREKDDNFDMFEPPVTRAVQPEVEIAQELPKPNEETEDDAVNQMQVDEPSGDPALELRMDVDQEAGPAGASHAASSTASPATNVSVHVEDPLPAPVDLVEPAHPSSTTPLDHHSPPQPISPPTTHAPSIPQDVRASGADLEDDAKMASTPTGDDSAEPTSARTPPVPVDREEWFKPTWDDFATTQGLMVPFLVSGFEERDQRRGEKMVALRNEYRAFDRDWQAHVKRLDKLKDRHQRKATKHAATSTAPQTPSIDSSGMPYYPEPATPGPLALGGGRANRRGGGGSSTSTWGYGDAVRSEAEFLEILASLEHADLRDPDVRAARTAAVVPDMAVDPAERAEIIACTFDDERYRVEDPVAAYGVSTPMDAWTEAEVETFCRGYAQHPKQFGKIAQGLPGRTTAECVLFYYRMKNAIDFRSLSERRGRDGRRKKTKKRPGKGSSLLSNLKGAKSTMLRHRDEDDEDDDEERPALASPRNARPPLPPTNPATLVPPLPPPPRADAPAATPRPSAGALDRLFEDDGDEPAVLGATKSGASRTPRTGNAQLMSEGMMEAAEVLGALGAAPTDDPDDAASASLRPRAAKTNRKVRMDLDDDGAIETPAATTTTERLKPKRKANSSSYWSAAEKADIVRLLEQHGKNWKAIGDEMVTKTAVQCRNWFTNNDKKLGLRNRLNGIGGPDFDDPEDESPAVTPLVQSPAVSRGPAHLGYFPTPDAHHLPPLPSIPTSNANSKASKAGMHLRNMLNEDTPDEEGANSAKEDWFGSSAGGRDDDASDDDSRPASVQSSRPVTATERVIPPQHNRIILSNGVARPSSHLPTSAQLPSFPTSLSDRRFDYFLPHQSASMPIPSRWSPAPGSPFASYGSPATPGPAAAEHYRRPTPPDYFQAKAAAFPHALSQPQPHRFSAPPPGSAQPSPAMPSTATFASRAGSGIGPGPVLPPSASLYQPGWTPEPRR
ncbi:hypothetical protein JCM11491_007097 [Sporobolomyces phaffii]